MKIPEPECPCKKTFGLASTEEMQKDMVAVACLAYTLKKEDRKEEEEPLRIDKGGRTGF
jgi:hypothetical protein